MTSIKRFLLAVPVVCFLFVVSCGCGTQENTPDSELESTITDLVWNLIEIGSSGEVTGAGGDSISLTLSGSDQMASGFSGCNEYNGSFEISGNSLVIGPMASTRMFCEDSMDLEGRYMAALEAVTRIQSDGLTLTLLDDTGTIVLRFNQK